MKNIVGQTPRGKDFFPREIIINKIYRRIEGGAHIFLAAPRRVGKTSIMRFLEDSPRPGYHFVYIITESAHDSETFYQKLLEEILKSPAVTNLARQQDKIGALVKSVIEKVEKVKIAGIELNLQSKEKESYQSAFDKFISEYDDGDNTLVIMIDEFPQTVENIKIQHGENAAKSFLRINREQRQQADNKIRFIYTGSIGLPSVVKKLTSTSVINDLNVIEIPPLTLDEATLLARQILDHYKVLYHDTVLNYLLDKIKWLIPFHIQLAVQELIDVYETSSIPLDETSVDKAFSQLLNVRNDIYFEHYYLRLKDVFTEQELRFVIALLDELSQNDTLNKDNIQQIAQEYHNTDNVDPIIEALIYDGYFHFDNQINAYRFNSYLLQSWWHKKNLR